MISAILPNERAQWRALVRHELSADSAGDPYQWISDIPILIVHFDFISYS